MRRRIVFNTFSLPHADNMVAVRNRKGALSRVGRYHDFNRIFSLRGLKSSHLIIERYIAVNRDRFVNSRLTSLFVDRLKTLGQLQYVKHS